MKTCSKCRRLLALTSFYIARAREQGKPDGTQNYCIDCTKQSNAETKLKIKLKGAN